MGSEQNVEIVKRWFDGMRSGQIDTTLFGPEMRMENVAEFPITGPYIGPEGVRQWWADLAEVIDGMVVETEEITAIDDEYVVTVQRLVGTFSNTGIPVDEHWAGLIRIEKGLIVQATGYGTRHGALEAADA